MVTDDLVVLGVPKSSGDSLMSTTTERRLARINAAAAYSSVNPRTIRRRVADGSLTGYRLGARILLVDLNELDALMRPIPTAGTVAC